MKGHNLGAFEELVLLAVCILREEAYGASVRKEIEGHTRRVMTLGAIHATLYRLQDKGILTSSLEGSTPSRGGRRKRVFAVTNAGLKALHEVQRVREGMWTLIPSMTLEGGLTS